MYVRLAFAVAAHLNPEILIVDEVLAVGDAEFQRKCLGKMKDVAGQGRTVLFVSHNMAAVSALCTTAIYLAAGQVVMTGRQADVLDRYVAQVVTSTLGGSSLATRTDRTGNGRLRLTGLSIRAGDGDDGDDAVSTVLTGDTVTFAFDYVVTDPDGVAGVNLGLSIHTMAGETLFVLYSGYRNEVGSLAAGRGQIRCVIDRFPISPGQYTVGARVADATEELDWPRDGVALLNVEAGDFYGTGRAGCEGSTHILVDGRFEFRPAASLIQA